jgi:hypothetical protein
MPHSRSDLSRHGCGLRVRGQSELALYLERMPAEGLGYLQRIRWILPVFGADYLLVGSDAYRRYVSSLQHLAESRRAWQLWLTVDMTAERGNPEIYGRETS